jgi:tetratricopeptide (TPR) repeat protein
MRSEPGALTETGTIVGTPAYMPLEQFEGAACDARSDQFSFAVSLHEGLYGVRPFAGATFEALFESLQRNAIEPAPEGSAVPSWVREALLPALAPLPQDRYPTLTALVERLRRDPRARRRRIAIAASIPLVIAGAVYAGTRHAEQPRAAMCRGADARLATVWNDTRRQAIHTAFSATGKPFAEDIWKSVARTIDEFGGGWISARTDACEATRVRGEQSEAMLDLRMECLDDRLLELDALTALLASATATTLPTAVRAAESLDLSLCADTSSLAARTRPPPEAIAHGQLQDVKRKIARASALNQVGDSATALVAAHEAADAANALGYAPLAARAYLQLGIAQEHSKEVDQARESIKQSVIAAEQGGDDELAIRGWSQLLLRELNRGELAAADEAAQHAEALLRKAPRADLVAARLAYAVAGLRQREGKYKEAEASARHAVELVKSASGADTYNYALVVDMLSKILSDAGRNADALELAQQALAIDERVLGPQHPEIAFVLDGIAGDLENLGRLTEAATVVERTLHLRELTLPADHPNLAITLANLAIMKDDLGDPGAAVDLDNRALAIFAKRLRPDHPSVAAALDNRSKALGALGKLDDALRDAEESLRIRRAAFGEEHDDVAASWSRLGKARLAKGQYVAALDALGRALAIDEKVLGKDHPLIVQHLLDIADVELHAKHAPAALAATERALALASAISVPPEFLGDAHFLRAQARWLSGNRAGARADADAARAIFAPISTSRASQAEVEAWLAKHPAAR